MQNRRRLLNKSILFISVAFFCAMAVVVWKQQRPPKLSEKQLAQKVFAFPMQNAVNRCKKEHGYSDDEMVLLEKELKRYLLMAMVPGKNRKSTGMYSSHVDNLWHCFILFTKEYQRFCLSTAGFFIHHVPELNRDQLKTAEEKAHLRDIFRSFIEDYEAMFGEEIHPIWLLDSAEKIS